MSIKLHQLAHARAGDKGNTSNISVIAYDERAWAAVYEHLTVELVAKIFSPLTDGPIYRYELPHLRALNFVIKGVLGGGVTRSLALDAHGKSLSYLMLNIDVPIHQPAINP